MPRYNHAYDFAFEVISDKEDASDVTNEMLLKACRERLDQAESDAPKGMIERVGGCPFDTMEVDE